MRNIIHRIQSLFSNDIGIDLGTANTLVYVRDRGIVLQEPSVVAVMADNNRVLAVGHAAKRMLGRTPINIVAVRPMRSGVIADFAITGEMLRAFIQMARSRGKVMRPRVLVAVPSGITPVEKNAVHASVIQAGARESFTVPEPMAAAIGVGIPVQEPEGNMIVDIGGGTTEVAVISLGGIVESHSVKCAGDSMDEAIIQHLKRVHSMVIGERMAEDIKIDIGSAYKLEQEKEREVQGRDMMSGLPKTITVSSEEIREAVREQVAQILKAIRTTLDSCPPELAADLVRRGIVLAGGGSMLRGLDRLISEETGLPVQVAEDPLTAVVRGTGAMLENSADSLLWSTVSSAAASLLSPASRKRW